MATPTSRTEEYPIADLQAKAYQLSKRMPDLLVDAKRAAQTITMGTHGRRRAGSGETFWQFRQFQDSDTASQIDWRRSASSGNLYIRETEWEAAHTVWLWSDLSPSMEFKSHLSNQTKLDRAIIFTLAVADLLARSGERVGLMDMLPPRSARNAAERCATAIIQHLKKSGDANLSLPSKAPLTAHSDCILFSDFLEPASQTIARLEAIASQGIRGHLVQILDPAEETLPYSGRTKFHDNERNISFLSERAETIRDRFTQKMRAHRKEITDACRRLQWSFILHHTDRPVEETLLSLHTHLSGIETSYRFTSTGSNPLETNDDASKNATSSRIGG